jgi:hypothetical protein
MRLYSREAAQLVDVYQASQSTQTGEPGHVRGVVFARLDWHAQNMWQTREYVCVQSADIILLNGF